MPVSDSSLCKLKALRNLKGVRAIQCRWNGAWMATPWASGWLLSPRLHFIVQGLERWPLRVSVGQNAPVDSGEKFVRLNLPDATLRSKAVLCVKAEERGGGRARRAR